MRKIFLIFLLCPYAYGAGPKYSYDNPRLNDEMDNIYKIMSFPGITYGTASTMTVTHLYASSATITNLTISSISGLNVGKVKKTNICSTTTPTSTTSGSYVTTALSCSISPDLTTDNVLVLSMNNVQAGASDAIDIIHKRGATFLTSEGESNAGVSATRQVISLIDLDSPLISGSTTYSVFVKRNGVTAAVIHNNVLTSTMFLAVVGAN